MFAPATREKLRLRLAVAGPSGSGKTFTALRMAHALVPGGRIAYVDTEHRSASKYVGEVVDDRSWAFDVVNPRRFAPQDLADAVRASERSGYDVLIVDSLTHYWSGPGGVLDIAGGKFTGWKKARPIEQAMWDAILASDIHIIATMRTKTVYEVSDNSRGKPAPTKVGTDSQQRDGAEYEFDIVLRMDEANTATIDKTRCSALQGGTYPRPGPELVETIREWLERGVEPPRKRVITPEEITAVKAVMSAKRLDPGSTDGWVQIARAAGVGEVNPKLWTRAEIDAVLSLGHGGEE